MKLLHIDSSITGAQSVSRQLSAASVERLRAIHPGLSVIYRDLASDPVPQQSVALLAAKATGQVLPDLSEADAVVDEFMAADIIVIGAPMYNFSIPSQLKAWIDCLAVAGKTFSYSESGVKGLAGGKRVIIASARGNIYTDTPVAALDHQESFLTGFFGFIGVTDLETVRAEGVAFGPEHRARAVENALTQAAAL
jgi:FMN-dependent NADH-azoreductase